jgi:four helix bundle protein
MERHPILDHEKLDVYRLSIEYQAWVGDLLDAGFGKRAKPSAAKHLDEASTSISNNIAEGNGKRSSTDRARFVEFACGSGLECAACIDALVARKLLEPQRAKTGKRTLHPQIRRHDECKRSEGAEGRPEPTPGRRKTECSGVEGEER